MCHVEPKINRKHIIFDKRGKPVLYVKMLKALYGLLRSALLFYRKLAKDLHKYGLKMNPYNPCVVNGMKSGKQLTVTFHVNDLEVSHMDPINIALFECYISSIYINKLVVHRVNLHDYLGINFDFSEKVKVKIEMIMLLEKYFESFTEDIGATATLSAGYCLFKNKGQIRGNIPP